MEKTVTLKSIYAALNEGVDKLNGTLTEGERIAVEKSCKDFCKDYNELSMLTAYSQCRKHPQPIIKLAESVTYPTVTLNVKRDIESKDGERVVVQVYSIKAGTANHSVLKFIQWLQERNVKLPAGWLQRMSAVKANILDQWRAYDEAKGDTAVFDFKSLKTVVQPMVDDMGFIKGKKGGNALVATKEHAQMLLKFANELTGTTEGVTLSPKNWDKLLMSLLHSLATSKAFQNEYGRTTVFEDEEVEG